MIFNQHSALYRLAAIGFVRRQTPARVRFRRGR